MTRNRVAAIAPQRSGRNCSFLLVLISLLQVASGTNVLQNCDLTSNIFCRHQLKPNQDNVESLSLPSSPPNITIPECTLDENGFYGDYWGFSAELVFFYEVSVNPRTESSEVQDEILPEVEMALVRKLLPNLFRDTCRNGTQRMLQLSNLRGISVLPSDLIMDSGTCPGDVLSSIWPILALPVSSLQPRRFPNIQVLCQETTTECFVVNAQMTLYGVNATSQLVTATQNIVDLMINGELDQGVDNRIVNIRFSNYTGVDRVVSEPSQAPVVAIGSDTGMPVWATVLIAITVFLACFCFCACPVPTGGDYHEVGSNTSNFHQQQQ